MGAPRPAGGGEETDATAPVDHGADGPPGRRPVRRNRRTHPGGDPGRGRAGSCPLRPVTDRFLFLDAPLVEEAAWAGAMHDGAGELLDAAVAAFGALPGWRADALKGALTAVGARRDLAPRAAQAPVRVAVTGRAVGLPSFESLEVPGRERTLARLRAARVRLP